jgi:hypothetical protein
MDARTLNIDSPLNKPASEPPQSNGGAAQATPAPQPQAAQPAPQPETRPPVEAPEQQPLRFMGWKDGKGHLPLRKKVNAHGDMVDELIFREPTGGDIMNIGNPVVMSIFEQNPKPVYDTQIMSNMMSHLATVPMPTIRTMDPRDWQNGALLLFHFFLPDRWI